LHDHPQIVTEASQTCAVVVTYNRKESLRECLRALRAQTHPLARILVVDNVSTDGTREMVAREFPELELLALNSNRGGAGGFHEGVKDAFASGFEWLWLMDDDSIPQPDAHAELHRARESFPAGQRPVLLASKVIWTDGSMHPMNVPRLKRHDSLSSACLAAEHGCVSIRSSSFVSLLLDRGCIERYGLPLASYFIWNDDVEYSARILRHEFGVLVPRSVVIHKTSSIRSDPGWKFYYGLRNTMWMVRRSPAWSGQEKIERLLAAVVATVEYVFRGFTLAKLGVVTRALWHGLTTNPKE
jgi:rhamnopyranosyl-N-acetylglucosaminyl-diphospho-decaprenol beta-1,3/1,4-galactofuranosyltransferase